MEWYLPFTLLSSVGLLVLSTSNLISGLNGEIYQIENMGTAGKERIIDLKLRQLKLISTSVVLQYVALFLFSICSIMISFYPGHQWLSRGTILLGVVLVSIALVLLIVFAYRAIYIRQMHLKP
jgi:hypothetical protein